MEKLRYTLTSSQKMASSMKIKTNCKNTNNGAFGLKIESEIDYLPT